MDILRVKRIEVVNDAGDVIGVLGSTATGGPWMSWCDTDGNERLTFAVHESFCELLLNDPPNGHRGGVILRSSNSSGTGGVVAAMGYANLGGAVLTSGNDELTQSHGGLLFLYNDRGKSVLSLSTTETGDGHVKLSRGDGSVHTVIPPDPKK